MKSIAGLVLVAAITLAGGSVGAEELINPLDKGCPDSPQPCDVEVESTSLEPSGTDPAGPSIVAPTPTVAQTAQLPITGGDVATLALIGGGLILGGVVLTRSRKLVAAEAD